MGDIFRKLKEVEFISELQVREDGEGGLSSLDVVDFRAKLAMHHSLLRQQEIFWHQKSRV